MNTFRTVLGTNHKKPRSRIWLEGERLKAAGFTVGTRYARAYFDDSLRLLTDPEGPFKVSGKGDKPIIDITGKVVTERFTGTHVVARFDNEMQTITIGPA